jgi:hypothetical protein
MIWWGFIVPWSVSRRRIVMSVMEPAPWWPMIGIPLIAAMSTALPEECSEMLPEAVRKPWPHFSDETVGLRPEAVRNSSVARTRRSTVPDARSRRPH